MSLRGDRLKVAIIGAGPAGLAAAIKLSRLTFVDWKIYDQARELREVGAGISIQPNTWRLLEDLDVAKNFHYTEIFRPVDNHVAKHRNGRTTENVAIVTQEGTSLNQLHARTQRSTFQRALLQEVDQSRLLLHHRLVKITRLSDGKQQLLFENGSTDIVDLVIGADGVRSVVRRHAFPDHQIRYTGKTSYRTLVPEDAVSRLNIADSVVFWHGPDAWVYTCPTGGGQLEITTIAREPHREDARKVSWGQDARFEDQAQHFDAFAPLVKEIIAAARDVKQFALFAGPRLESITAQDSIVLVGDASHPLSGAFGAGAGFALEDVYAFGQSLEWAHKNGHSLAAALDLVDRVRTPQYKKMYEVLNGFSANDTFIRSHNPPLSFDDAVEILIRDTWSIRHHWIFEYDIQDAWRQAAQVEEEKQRHNRGRTLDEKSILEAQNTVGILEDTVSRL